MIPGKTKWPMLALASCSTLFGAQAHASNIRRVVTGLDADNSTNFRVVEFPPLDPATEARWVPTT